MFFLLEVLTHKTSPYSLLQSDFAHQRADQVCLRRGLSTYWRTLRFADSPDLTSCRKLGTLF